MARLWGSGFIPTEHQGVRFRSGEDPVLYLSNPPGVDPATRRRMLDGVGELSASAQTKLMDALESRTIVRLGGRNEVPIDVRVLGATHRDLPAEVAAKRFREDLYYSLSSFTLRVPPLRERAVEVDLLAYLFANRFAALDGHVSGEITAEAAAALAKYDWPENVRELREAMRYAVGMSHGRAIDGASLPEAVRRRTSVRAQISGG